MTASRNGLALVKQADVPSETVDRVLAGARSGRGGSLVLRGEVGTLLEYAAGRATAMRVVRLAGVESESTLDFAALHQLLIPFLPDLDRLPEPQRDALRSAFGLVTAPTPNRFLVGLAVLGLLAQAAADEPLLVLIDDAQWLDNPTSEVLAFVARRLSADRIALVISVPEPAPGRQPFPDLPQFASTHDRPLTAVPRERRRRAPLDALHTGLLAGRFAHPGTLLDLVRAPRSITRTAPNTADLLTDGFAAQLSGDHQTAVPLLRHAVDQLLADESAALPQLAVGSWAAGEIMDSKAQQIIVDRWAQAAGGQMTMASTAPSQSEDLLTLAWSGREAEARSAATQYIRQTIERGHGLGVTFADYALTILELGSSHYEAALTHALSVCRDNPPDLGTHVLPDLVEAATRIGCQETVRPAVKRFSDRASASGTPLASGLLARTRALLADDADAEGLYREAIDHLRRAGVAAQVARTHLVYGEWLRRRRRRRNAREHLRTARDMFDAMGATAFARRASAELQATNEHTGESTGLLTPQEMQVARLVSQGAANREVAAQLYISLNTVEYHLQKVYRKLGVSSRTQLARTALDQPPVS